MSTRKEIEIILIERDKITETIKKLEEKYRSGLVSKLDYQVLHERYESKLKEIEQKLGVKKEKKPRKLARLRFWRKKSS